MMKKETSQEKTLNHFFYEMFSTTKKFDGISFRNQSNKNTLFSACHTSKTSTSIRRKNIRKKNIKLRSVWNSMRLISNEIKINNNNDK